MSRALFVLKNAGHHGRRHRRSNRMSSAGRRKLSRLAKARPRHRSGRFMKTSRNRGARHNRHAGRRHGRARSVRFNGIGLRSNGIGLRSNGIGLRSNTANMAKGLLGWGLAVVVPIIAGAGTLGLVHLGLMAVDWTAVQLPASIQPYADKVLGWVEPVGYTAGAMAAASLVGLLSWIRILPPKWAALFGSVAVIGGAAVDAFRFITSEPAAVPKIVAVQTPDGAMHGISAMGDGGAWALGNGAGIHQISQTHQATSAAFASPTQNRSRMASARMMAQR